MDNFTFHNPTRIHFGKGQIARVAEELPADAKVLLLAGGGSIRSNGTYDQVKTALGARTVHEHWGVEANPDFDTLMPAVELCRTEGIDWVLAVGGGSVLDGAKFVCAAVNYDGDPWQILVDNGASVKSALPLGTVLTLPATGSEANMASVISRRAIQEKLHFLSPFVFPVFSVLDPETTYSLPTRQIANGIGDAFCHVMEQYLTFPANVAAQDQFAEGILRVLIAEGPKSLANPTDYDARANLVWAATCALNGFIGVGVPQDWSTHTIGHELTSLHVIDHACTLPTVMPSAELLGRVEGLTEGVAAGATLEFSSDMIAGLVEQGPEVVAAVEQRAWALRRESEALQAVATAVHEQQTLAALAKVVAVPDAEIDLFWAALLIARLDNPEVEVEASRADLKRLAASVAARLADDASQLDEPQARPRYRARQIPRCLHSEPTGG